MNGPGPIGVFFIAIAEVGIPIPDTLSPVSPLRRARGQEKNERHSVAIASIPSNYRFSTLTPSFVLEPVEQGVAFGEKQPLSRRVASFPTSDETIPYTAALDLVTPSLDFCKQLVFPYGKLLVCL